MNSLQRIALRNVRLNWRHSLAALLSIAASFFSLVIFEGYIRNVSSLYYDSYRYRSMYGDVLVENKKVHTREGRLDPFRFYLGEAEQNFITEFARQHGNEIHSTVRSLSIQGLITNGRASAIFIGKGHDLKAGYQMRGDHWAWNVLYGIPLANSQDPQALVLGQALGNILNCKPVRPMKVASPTGGYIAEERPLACDRNDVQLSVSTESGQLNALDMNVVGLMDGGYRDVDDKLVSLSLENAQTLLNTKKISQQTFQLVDPKMTPLFMRDFDQASTAAGFPDLKSIRWQDHDAGELYRKTVSLLSIFRNFVVIVIVTISCLSVLNTMVKVVKERTREIGTLLSIGFRKTQVMQIFLQEAFLLALLGCTMGGILALIVGLIINRVPIYYKAGLLSQPVLFQVELTASSYVVSAVMLTTLTVVTAYFACRGTLHKKIVECLTHV